MENLKSYTLYNQRLNKLIKSYQIKKPYTLQSLEASLSKRTPSKSKPSETNNTPTKILYININKQFDAGVGQNCKIPLPKTENNSVSKVIMNYSFDKQSKKQLLPFLRGKKNIKSKNYVSEMNKTTGFQSRINSSKIVVQDNSTKVMKTQDAQHNFIFIRDEPSEKLKKPFTPIKISLKYRKNSENKVNGKFDTPFYESKPFYKTMTFKNGYGEL